MSNIYANRSISKITSAIILLFLLSMGTAAHAQNILFVNDNDNILYNTDTVVNDMNQTIYSGYHYWSVPDSGFNGPSAAYMANFDLVIWYCSTDGSGLELWNGSAAAGNPEILTYAASGKPIWIIGLDILYQKYATGTTFPAGDFPKDIMGLTSYDVQSYIDDASAGCPEVNRTATASTLFPANIQWSFSTLWYIDGCTKEPATLDLYEMGPASYALYQKKCMFHNKQGGKSVMSTFFDPALINTYSNRINFLEKGITYLLSSVAVKNPPLISRAALYPNPATSTVTLEMYAQNAGEVTIELFNQLGSRCRQQKTQIAAGKNLINTSLHDLSAGLYLVKVTDASGRPVYSGKLSKE